VINRHLKTVFILIVTALLSLTSTACFNKRVVPVPAKGLVELEFPLNTASTTNRGWVIARGSVINRGGKRANWLQVTVYTKDRATGIILDKKTTYVRGSGPNGKSLDPGESGSFELRLDTKTNHLYEYEADLFWSEDL